jgi:hypothetical protein
MFHQFKFISRSPSTVGSPSSSQQSEGETIGEKRKYKSQDRSALETEEDFKEKIED